MAAAIAACAFFASRNALPLAAQYISGKSSGSISEGHFKVPSPQNSKAKAPKDSFLKRGVLRAVFDSSQKIPLEKVYFLWLPAPHLALHSKSTPYFFYSVVYK